MQVFFVKLIMEIVKWIAGSAKPTVIEGAGPGEMEDRLKDRLKEAGW